jgi:RNA polymerase sigma-70 factor (ECF subfamily)
MGPSGDSESAAKIALSSLTLSAEILDKCARLRPRISTIARALLRHSADADDATQASLLEILHAAESFRGEGSFEGWADRIAVRTTLRLARQRRVRGLRVDEAEPDAIPADPPEPSMREELPRELGEYLAELPEIRRTALVLRHALGYSIEEIAELTAVSPNTVKDRLLAAREQVRKHVRRDLATGSSSRRSGA